MDGSQVVDNLSGFPRLIWLSDIQLHSEYGLFHQLLGGMIPQVAHFDPHDPRIFNPCAGPLVLHFLLP